MFEKTTWVDGSPPDITAAQLNRMEDGIEEGILAGGGALAEVTALPPAPADGQEVLLNPGGTLGDLFWHLRWKQSLGRWLYRGGPAIGKTWGGSFQTSSTSSVSLPTPVKVTLGWGGTWELLALGLVNGMNATAIDVNFELYDGATLREASYSRMTAQGQKNAMFISNPAVTLGPGDVEIKVKNSTAAQVEWMRANLLLRPVRIAP